MRLFVEGWRFLAHSYAMLNQFQLLELRRRSDIELYHRDIPYYVPRWPVMNGLFDPEREAVLRSLPAPPVDQLPDATLRLSVPFNFVPAPAGRTFVWCTTEWGLVQNELLRMMKITSLADVLPGSGIKLITPSQWSREGLLRSGATADDVAVVPLGVDPDIFRPLPDEERTAMRRQRGADGLFLFLNVGMMTTNKGTHGLLKAFARVAERHPEARLLLKGGDKLYDCQEFVRRAAREALTPAEIERVQQRLIYRGEPLSCAQQASLYQMADAYVSPYLAEGFNLPVLEAAACGLPAICTQGGATDDFTHPDFALGIQSEAATVTLNQETRYIRKPDLDHLTTLMESVLADPAITTRARQAGPRRVQERFTWKHIVDQLLAVLTARK